MRTVLTTLLALLVCATAVPALQDAGASGEEPAQPDATSEVGGDEGQQVPDGFQPGRLQNVRARKIGSIVEHRKSELAYVPRMHEVPQVDLTGVDTDALMLFTIDGVSISRNTFRKRALLYASAGDLERHALRTITGAELSRRASRGDDISALMASPADIEAKLGEYEALIRMQIDQGQVAAGADPGELAEAKFEEWKQAFINTVGEDKFQQYLASDAQFEKVFLPVPTVSADQLEAHKAELVRLGESGELPMPVTVGEGTMKPAWMPQATWDAFMLNEQTRGLLGFVMTQGRNQSGLPQLFKPSIISSLREGIMRVVGVRFFFDEVMPDDVLMRVGDHEVGVDEAWLLINPVLTDADVELILREIVALHVASRTLRDAGVWIDDEEWAGKWREYEKNFEGTLLPMKTVLTFRGYNSVHRFREHLRYGKSFNQLILDEITEDAVLDHFQGGGRLFFEKGEVVLAPAFLPLEGDTSLAAFDTAQAEMAQFIEEHPDDWDAVQARYPTPGMPGGESTIKGQRNRLNMAFRESELTQLVTGYGLVHEAFYLGQEGAVIGPWAATMRHHQWGDKPGVWAVRIVEYIRPGGLPQFVKGDRNYDMAFEDYINLRFIDWLNAGVSAALPTIALP